MERQVALITGGTSGIGEETVRLFLQKGFQVVFTGRNASKGKQLQQELGENSFYVEAGDFSSKEDSILDHTNRADCLKAVEETEKRFGRLNVLFNNAGIVLVDKNAEETTEEEWEQVMSLNITSVWRMCKFVDTTNVFDLQALPLLRKAGGGVIVNNASDWGLVGGRDAVAYCTSKGAVIQMTKAMALDHAKENIRVNAVCPVSFKRQFLSQGDTFVARWIARDRHLVCKEGENVDDAEVERRLRASNEIPMGRVGNVSEIAKAVYFLASPDSSFITGVALPVDGGNTAQ